MKIKEIIKESNEDIIKKLRNDCSQTIDLMKKSNEAIYHSSNFLYQDIEKITPNQGRTPKDTPQLLHNLINEYLDEKGIKTNRSNSIFGLKNYEYLYGFGEKPFVLFPINNASVLWFENSDDLFLELKKYFKENFNVKIKNLDNKIILNNKLKHIEFLNSLEPNTSLKEYFYNDNPDLEIMISSSIYVVKYDLFKTTDFKEQIGLIGE